MSTSRWQWPGDWKTANRAVMDAMKAGKPEFKQTRSWWWQWREQTDGTIKVTLSEDLRFLFDENLPEGEELVHVVVLHAMKKLYGYQGKFPTFARKCGYDVKALYDRIGELLADRMIAQLPPLDLSAVSVNIVTYQPKESGR
jgi:hypothetical protein